MKRIHEIFDALSTMGYIPAEAIAEAGRKVVADATALVQNPTAVEEATPHDRRIVGQLLEALGEVAAEYTRKAQEKAAKSANGKDATAQPAQGTAAPTAG